MTNYKNKIMYCAVLVILLFIGIVVGYMKTASFDVKKINNTSVVDFAKNYYFVAKYDSTVTASTKTYDITVVYEDYYKVCKESVTTTNVKYGTTMDKVKADEKKYQEERGLEYNIAEETNEKIVYSRILDGNCPNHFKVIYENGKVNVYSIQGENKSTLYMSVDINLENVRDELKQKVERGININSRSELNKFIEDLES